MKYFDILVQFLLLNSTHYHENCSVLCGDTNDNNVKKRKKDKLGVNESMIQEKYQKKLSIYLLIC